MSLFKTKWIIIKIYKVKDWEFLYTIFTKEYWKILCNKKLSKKEKTLDLWYIVNFEISTKQNQKIHKIRNIKILSEFNREDKKFNILNNYLIILAVIVNKIPSWLPINELFEIIEKTHLIEDITEVQLILIKLKIISILWELNDNNDNEIVQKILKFININKIDRIVKLTWIDAEITRKLEKI